MTGHTILMRIAIVGCGKVAFFASGATATITATTGVNHNVGCRVTVVGETGAIGSVLEFPEGHQGVNEIWTIAGEETLFTPFDASVPAQPDVSTVNARLGDFHTVQVQDFAEAVLTGRPPAVTGRDARTSPAIVTAIYESSRTGMVVDITPQRRKAAL